MKQTVKRILVLLVGWAFIVLGIAGLFLPILQGILFLLIGLIILSSEYVWAHRLLNRIKQRFPKIAEHAHQAHLKADQWLHRMRHHEEPQKTKASTASRGTPGAE